MKPRTIVFIVIAIASLIIGYVISTYAQWDTDEEVQRVEEKQWQEAEQGTGPVEREATGVRTPPRTTKGEKKLEKWEGIPTGYARRDYLIRQDNIAGKWDKANILPVSDKKPRWKPIDGWTYNTAMKSGIVDAKLKGSIYAPFYESMMRVCKAGPKAKEVHIKSPASEPKWRIGQKTTRPRTQYRELKFECLIKTR